MKNKKIKITIVYRDITGSTHNNMFYSIIIIDEADLERIFPFLIREDIARIEIQEYDGPLMNDIGEKENGK